MANNISEEEVRQAVAKVRHPEINFTLMELGMIDDITICDDKVIIIMALPFLEIPIKDYLVHSVHEAVTKFGMEVEVKLTEMNQEQRDIFMTMSRKGWIG